MKKISRRSFLKIFGTGAAATAVTLTGCKNPQEQAAADDYKNQVEPPKGKMTYRINPNGNEKVSLLGYGMMRLPTVGGSDESEDSEIDQEQVNRLVDYAIEHGVNYFDTSPVYLPI